MRSLMIILATVVLFASSVLLTGCPAVVVVGAAAGGGYVAGKDERSVGEQVDDVNLAASIKREFSNEPMLRDLKLEVQSYQGRVFIVGVKEEQVQEEKALEIARNFKETVSAEAYMLEAPTEATMGEFAKDAAIGAEVKSRLLRDKNIPSTKINVETVRGHVVLLGIVENDRIVHDAVYQAGVVVGGEEKVKSFLIVGGENKQ